MKRTSGILALILVFSVVLSCMAPLAGAAENTFPLGMEYTGPRYVAADKGGYLAIGDSITRGYGACDLNYYHDYSNRYIPNSYPLQVAQSVGCNITDYPVNGEVTGDYWCAAVSGETLSVVLDLLDVDDGFDDPVKYTTNKGAYGLVSKMFELFGDGKLIEMVQKASLITLNVGLADVTWRAGVMAGDVDMLFSDGADAEAILEFVGSFIRYLNEGYCYFERAYPLLLQRIKYLNPDADIVIVSNFNVVGDMTIKDDMFLPVGDVLSLRVGMMNEHLRQWAQEYGCAYADVSNTQVPGSINNWSFMMDGFMDVYDAATHPDPTGYAYIARQILSTLEPAIEEPVIDDIHVQFPIPGTFFNVPVDIPGKIVTEVVQPKTDITVDLGRFKKINYVMLDKKILGKDGYSMDGYELTVKNCSKNAKVLTVVVVQEDGKVAVQTYQLSYTPYEGYSAYRLYTTNDAVTTVETVVTSIISRGTTILKTITGLFKKKA